MNLVFIIIIIIIIIINQNGNKFPDILRTLNV